MGNNTEKSDLGELRSWIKNHLRLRISDDGAVLEDLTQIIITDYWKYNNKQPKENRFDESDLMSEESRSLAYRILQRRVADHYRKQVAHSSLELSSSLNYEEYGDNDPLYKLTLNKSILLELMVLMTNLPEEDRELLLRDIKPTKKNSPVSLSSSERKKISRLRKKLAERIERKFGESLSSLLK